jgi:uncharacterized protein with PQ loop repeat
MFSQEINTLYAYMRYSQGINIIQKKNTSQEINTLYAYMRYSQGINIIQKKNTQGPSRKFFYMTTCGGYIPTKKK